MIEATCAACGTVARIAEADVPTGAKFVTCASCKARVTLPQQKASATPAKGIKSVSIPAIPSKVPPVPPSMKSKSDALEIADLPAPKRASPLSGAEPSKSGPVRSPFAGADLPAPRSAKPPAPAPGALDLDDLMGADLPAPKAKSDAGFADLPAPKPKTSALGDLPAAKGKQPNALADLPAPRATPPAAKKPMTAAGLADLPMPKAKSGAPTPSLDDELDLPMPKPGANNDLPAPKGFFDDLPQPARSRDGGGAIDLPAPKGFFDDLPQPARSAGASTQDVAPKGFFDDLPQPAKGGGKGAGSQDLTPRGPSSQDLTPKGPSAQDVAPKGFFDDLPQPATAGGKGGLFDDLPEPAKGAGSVGLFDDLPQPTFGSSDIDLGPASGPSLELDSAGPELDLGLPLGQDSGFQDLDLGEPTKSPAKGPAGADEGPSPIKIKTPAKGAAPAKPIAINVPKDGKPGELKLDLAEDPHGAVGAPAAAGSKAATAAAAKQAAKKAAAEETAEAKIAKRKRQRIVLGAVLGVAALGAGGFTFYQRHAKAKARAEQIASGIDGARKALRAEPPTHWQTAAAQAQSVIQLDATNTQALGLAAEAQIAGALDTGINGTTRIAQGRTYLQDGIGAGKITPELERAQAVAFIAANQPDKAVPKLQQLIGREPKDGWLQLYLGWAQLGIGDADAALKAFDAAVANTKETKIPALYGHGRAKLMQADIEGARTDFGTVLEAVKAVGREHVCAQVQLAATLPPSKAAQRDGDLKAILERKDVKANQADPRCITQVYTNLGDVARMGGFLEVARENYRKAIALTPTDVQALAGLARVEIRDGKLQVAADLVQKAAAANANDPDTQLVTGELLVAQGKLGDAEKLIAALAERKPPLVKLDMAQLQVIKGRLLEAQGKPEDAINAYAEGAKLAGDLDLTPTMAAVRLLTELAKKEPDEAKATVYRQRADQLLSALAERAQEDGQLSTQLGVAYLQAGDPAKAETFLSRAVALREDDPEAKLALGKALSALGRTDEAIVQIQAALKIDPNRIGYALELALTYQAAGRDGDAIAAFEKLLAMPDVPLTVRSNAGRFFAKKALLDRKPELMDKAVAQAAPILKEEPDNPAGLYLKAESLIKAGKFDEAAPVLTKATDADPDAQYLDALGRANEGRLVQSKDSKYIEAARSAYERASKADPKLVHALVGQGHMLVMRGGSEHYDQALKPLIAAEQLDKTSSEIMYWMGMAYYGLRTTACPRRCEHAKAAALWLEAALHKGQPELPLDLRAEAAFKLGDLY
ncbi:MAG TPA: tetratricopeptide repeat protein, partial [Kofleriaceae bacterium]|nr:tetratricopeptide repeat protein [Kofleriaceae bacterium]